MHLSKQRGSAMNTTEQAVGSTKNFGKQPVMLKLLLGLFAVAALAVLGHAVLVYSSESDSRTAPAALSTCSACHG